jgi:hypothetical protein
MRILVLALLILTAPALAAANAGQKQKETQASEKERPVGDKVKPAKSAAVVKPAAGKRLKKLSLSNTDFPRKKRPAGF